MEVSDKKINFDGKDYFLFEIEKGKLVLEGSVCRGFFELESGENYFTLTMDYVGGSFNNENKKMVMKIEKLADGKCKVFYMNGGESKECELIKKDVN